MDREKFDYSKLKGRITEICDSQKVFAERLGVSEGTLVSKLKCNTYFTQNEIFRASEILGISPANIAAYFFMPSVQKVEQY